MKLSEKQAHAVRDLIESTELFLSGIAYRAALTAKETVNGEIKTPLKTLDKLVEEADAECKELMGSVVFAIEAFTGEVD
jgi:hypothetical protein